VKSFLSQFLNLYKRLMMSVVTWGEHRNLLTKAPAVESVGTASDAESDSLKLSLCLGRSTSDG
jgi:hypothetical protein